MHRLLLPALCGLALAAAGCGSSNTTPTTPDAPETIVEQFTGTLSGPNDAQTHFFQTTTRGSVLATIGELSIDGTIVGFEMGTANGELCTRVQGIDTADEGTRILLAVSAAGNLCVRIYNPRETPVDYFIQVEHP